MQVKQTSCTRVKRKGMSVGVDCDAGERGCGHAGDFVETHGVGGGWSQGTQKLPIRRLSQQLVV